MNGNEATAKVIATLEEMGIPYMVVGSFSSNVYGVARSTKDADIVIDLGDGSVRAIADRLGPDFRLDPQMSFGSVTTTSRFTLELVGTEFTIELFLLSDDPYDQERFRRRRRYRLLGREGYLPTPEDVILNKLRWAVRAKRPKDQQDVFDVIAVQGDRLDWDYIHRWADAHGSRQMLDEIRRSIPEIEPGGGEKG